MSDGNPIEDLTEVLLESYELLAKMTNNYTPTGNSRHDNSVHRIIALMERWPAAEIVTVRENSALDRRKPSQAPPPPPPPNSIVFEDPDSSKQIVIEEKLAALDVSAANDNVDTPKPLPKVSTPTSRGTATRSSKNNDYFLKLKEVSIFNILQNLFLLIIFVS